MAVRFQQSNESVGKPRGYARTYHIEDDGRVRWSCDVTNDLWPGVRFVPPDAAQPEFSMVPSRRIMPLSYRVVTAEDGDVLGLISRSLLPGCRWKLESATAGEVARIVNPTAWPQALLEQAFDRSVMRFAFMREDVPLGFVLRRPRPPDDRPGNRLQRWVRQRLTLFDWTLELERDVERSTDLRMLIAATVLLLELDVNVQG